jgi:hypothetical protein
MTIAVEELVCGGIAFESDYAMSLFLPVVGGNSMENASDRVHFSVPVHELVLEPG